MKIIEIIKADDIEEYYITNVKFLPKKHSIEFTLTSSKKELPDITMVISYISLFPNSSLFMVSSIDTKKLGFMVSAVADQELSEIGKTMTKSLYALLSHKGSINYEKETHAFKGYRSELGVTD
ncbi:hypothetical protein LCGC14_1392600 [marine sediment metagenome]|uniref:Uncharacterized protein n=1 Tax=marine sediment metagenome TaxID=412755 RepID=A0A0F9JZM7_9ZZZZ